MGIQINGITDTISATDGGLAVSGQQLTGVTDINASGIVTATQGYVVGTGASIFSPAANTLALGTNGSERIRITSAGLVGIGVLSPSSVLDLNGSLSISGKTTDVGPARITHHTNNYFYVRGGTAGAILSDQAGNNTVRVENSGSILFETNNGSERVRIDSSGRLLVGTSSARTTQHSIGGNNVYDVVAHVQHERTGEAGGFSAVVNKDDASGPFLNLAKARGSSVGSNTIVASGDVLGTIGFFGADGSDITSWGGAIQCFVDGTPGNNDMPGRLVFSTTADNAASPTERMRIRSDGAVLYHSSANNGIVLGITGTSGTSNRLFSAGHSASSIGVYTETFLVWSNGNVQNTNGSYTAISDAKLKENIVDANSQWNDLKKIKIRNWNFKKETGHETHRQIGPIAQELKEVCPGLVFETPDRDTEGNDLGTTTKVVNQSILYMKAVKALQEAMERIETLESKVAALEAS